MSIGPYPLVPVDERAKCLEEYKMGPRRFTCFGSMKASAVVSSIDPTVTIC